MSIHRLRNRFYGTCCSIFRTLDVILSWSEVQRTRCWLICPFTGFETGFTVFAVLFLEVSRLFWVDFRYRCQDTGENVHSLAYKTVFPAFAVYFLKIGGYFVSIGGTVSKIRSKIFIWRLWSRFYVIRCFIFSTLGVILSQLKMYLPRYMWKRSLSGFETDFTALADLFLELWRLFKVDQRYRCQITGKNVHLTA